MPGIINNTEWKLRANDIKKTHTHLLAHAYMTERMEHELMSMKKAMKKVAA